MFKNMDSNIGYVVGAVIFLIWNFHPTFLRDSILSKLVMVASLIALTIYHRIAGIIGLIVIIAVLNQDKMKEGMTNPSMSPNATPAPSPSISFKTPDEFRQKYCVSAKGVPDDMTESGKSMMTTTYMLSPSFFTKLDASGNPVMEMEQINAIRTMDQTTFNEYNKCKPLKPGSTSYMTISNVCDPKCNWSIKTPAPTTSPITEGFTQSIRSHIRNGRNLLTTGIDNLKANATRLKRKLF
jgi:hypothetical protein